MKLMIYLIAVKARLILSLKLNNRVKKINKIYLTGKKIENYAKKLYKHHIQAQLKKKKQISKYKISQLYLQM